MKLFISYARVDHPVCEIIVKRLSRIHEVWYDQRLFAGEDWWESIQEKLAWCDGFVYLMSPESIASEYCQKEYGIAQAQRKEIFPVLIQARTTVPEELSRWHYADVSSSMENLNVLTDALQVAERRLVGRRVPTIEPVVKPESRPGDVEPRQAVAFAAEAMEDEDFDRAVFILRQTREKVEDGTRYARIIDGVLADAEAALAKQMRFREAEREYAPIVETVQRNSTRRIGCEELDDFLEQFPDYGDPENLTALCADAKVSTTPAKIAVSILPDPFAWIEIPAGKVTLVDANQDTYIGKKGQKKTFDVPAFAIAKYPITNAQFAIFVEAKGYDTEKWWTTEGWKARQSNEWVQPRLWGDSQYESFNQPEHPVVGVSWFESVAFCQWLSEASGAKILLPTEQMWQRAAQGEDGRAYPWGNEWDSARCNNNFDKKGIGSTTPVTEYEGREKGDSLFGVTDMAGNVWEWCSTDYKNGHEDLNKSANYRVLRVGSWYDYSPENFRVDYRDGNVPDDGNQYSGFRIIRF